MKKILIFSIPFFLAGCFFSSWGNIVTFERPDIKDEFCGVHINYQYCKCAFHNEFCDAIGLDKSGANSYVQAQYSEWIDGLLADFKDSCDFNGGYFDDESCKYCKEGQLLQNAQCVDAAEYVEPFKPDGPLTAECEIKQDEFDMDWKKYSDIDEAIPFEERSYEAKQALTVYDEMIDNMIEGFAIERDIEIERQLQSELQEYRQALVQNIKTNLLKAFWRLSWVTYSTVKSGQGTGTSYSKLLTNGASVETVGAGLKVIQGIIPSDSQLAIDKSSLSGKAKSVGANVAIKAVDSLGDPVKIATELFKSASNASLPSANISQEEIDILREQHVEQGLLDEVISDSNKSISDKQQRLAELEAEIAAQQQEISDWEQQEKERVRVNLEESCKELKQRYESQ